jgi:lipid II:glycine glycyltransferase (peptidoglycan interpeptide bridge formation enzyme)
LDVCEQHKIDLPPTYDEWFTRRGGKKNRQKIRKARDSGVSVSIGGREFLSDFYQMYVCSWRRWTDQQKANWRHHPLERFERMFAVPGSRIRVAIAYLDGEVIGAVLASYYPSVAAPLYAGIHYEHRNVFASNLLHSELIRDGIEQGFTEYNMGTSRGLGGIEKFKETLGAVRHESVVLCRYRFRRLKKFMRAMRRGGSHAKGQLGTAPASSCS